MDRLSGRDVILHSLAKRPELNGLCGRTDAKFDAAKGRLVVRLFPLDEPKATPLLLKPENLLLKPSTASAIAANCASEHADEVRSLVDDIADGKKRDGSPHLVLDLEDTGLHELPESIGTLSLTHSLWLGNNGLTALPNAVGQLRSLTQLDVDGNALTTLPDTIGDLPALEALFANRNRFASLPVSLRRLKRLRELRLADNQLGSASDALPASLATGDAAASLRVLWLARNGLSSVPACVCELLFLEELDLSGNSELKALPRDLAKLTSLSVLELADMPQLASPPAHVCAKGAAVVRRWLARADVPPPSAESTVEVAAATAAPPAAVEEVEPVILTVPHSSAHASAAEVAPLPQAPAAASPSAAPEVHYAHEPADSVHRPMAPEDLGGLGTEDGGTFVFPARPRWS